MKASAKEFMEDYVFIKRCIDNSDIQKDPRASLFYANVLDDMRDNPDYAEIWDLLFEENK